VTQDTKKVLLKLRYETGDGKLISAPENYPEEVELAVPTFGVLTSEMILEAILQEIAARGVAQSGVCARYSVNFPDWPVHLQNFTRH